MSNSALKAKILWRVYITWLFKRILPLLVLELAILVVAVYLLARFVFIEKVVSNTFLAASNSPLLIVSFMFSAFLYTTFLNQAIIVVLLSLGILLLRDFGRALVSYRSTSRAVKPR